jgi:ribonuclease BN (tRNA processing enzyme)
VELFQRLRSNAEVDTTHLQIEDRHFVSEHDVKVLEFIRGSEVLILDSQYNAAEYQKHIGWGHSCAEDAVAFALKAKVKRLFMFHHDPDHDDDEVSRMVARARQMVARRGSALIVEAAREGVELVLNAVAK